MGMMGDLNDKAKDMMDDPDTRSRIQKMAEEKGISIEEAKQRYMQQKDDSNK